MNRQEATRVLSDVIEDRYLDDELTDLEADKARFAFTSLLLPHPAPAAGLARCNWCGPERIGWFSVQFWVRACYGKRKWMSVTQDWKKKVKYCPMCGRKLGEG